MKGPRVHPRFDQIDELTRGVPPLPLPAIADVHLQVLAEGLGEAFNDLRVRKPVAMASRDEPEVTALIHARLIRMTDERTSLWSQLVSSVTRGSESVSFDGSHLEKRPDLSIHLSSRDRSGFPLVVEAKILDASAKTEAAYCGNGLLRFVSGEYAWACSEAIMIGYVRDGSSIAGKLRPFLMKDMAFNTPTYLVQKLPVPVRGGTLDLAHTRHGRNFLYPCQVPNSPGPISVWHLWLA